jgi:hypothetical protein
LAAIVATHFEPSAMNTRPLAVIEPSNFPRTFAAALNFRSPLKLASGPMIVS